jgi:hypothetical protein
MTALWQHRLAPPATTLTLPRWLAPLVACVIVAMVPWMVFLGMTLPAHDRAEHYDLAWVGFDVALWLVFAALAVSALRRSAATGPVAAVAAAMLVVDAWFDVTTSHGSEFLDSVVLAVVAEIPLAALCAWVAVRAQREISSRAARQ